MKHWRCTTDIYFLIKNGNKATEGRCKISSILYISHLARSQPHSLYANYNVISSFTRRSPVASWWGWVPKPWRVHQWDSSREHSNSEYNVLSRCATLPESALETIDYHVAGVFSSSYRSFLLTLNTFHTLSQYYYSNFEKYFVNFCQIKRGISTYVNNYTQV